MILSATKPPRKVSYDGFDVFGRTFKFFDLWNLVDHPDDDVGTDRGLVDQLANTVHLDTSVHRHKTISASFHFIWSNVSKN